MEIQKLIKVTAVLLLVINVTLSLDAATKSQIIETPATNGGDPLTVTADGTKDLLSGLLRKARQSRCIRCYEDRYVDDGSRPYTASRYYTTGTGSSGGGGGGSIGTSGYVSSRGDDRYNNWYYPTDRYDRTDDTSRARYYEDRYPERSYGGGDRYQERERYPATSGYHHQDRYSEISGGGGGGRNTDDRYYSRTYDRYDARLPSYYDRYDTRAPLQVDDRGYGGGRDGYSDRYNSRDRPYDRVRGGGSYDSRPYERESYDRYSPPRVIGYDYRNYRPVDETYRGQSGFDNSGRGYYFANERPNDLGPPSSSSQHNRPPYSYPPPSTPGQPYLPNSGGQPPPRPLHQTPPNASSSGQSPTGNGSGNGDYNNRPSRPDDKDTGYAGSWSYANDRDKSGYRGDRDKDAQSSAYGGGRQRPLTGSYLLDRESNIPMATNTNNDNTKPSNDLSSAGVSGVGPTADAHQMNIDKNPDDRHHNKSN